MTSPYVNKLEQLKNILATAKDTSTIFEFFLTEFGENLEFMDGGTRSKNEVLEAVLRSVGEEIFGKKGKVKGLKLLNVPDTKFFHGLCEMGGQMATVIYFDDIGMGLVAIMMGPKLGQFTYARFSTMSVDPSYVGRLVTPDRRTIQ